MKAPVEQNSASDTPLFARASDPQTSKDAMRTYDREKLAGAVAAIVHMHKSRGPLADFQQRKLFPEFFRHPCCDHLYRQARSVARDRGLLRDTGRKLKDPETKRDQIVWEACDESAKHVHRCPTCGHVLRRQIESGDKPHGG